MTAAAEVAAAARVLARLGFVHAFGHVSARGPDGAGVLLTPTSPPLGALGPGDLLELDARRPPPDQAARTPIEAPMHLAVYAGRADVGAVCRIHAPATATWAAIGTVPPLLHGFGGMVEPVAVWDDPDLIATTAAARRVAAALGDAPALLLRGNGGLVVGATLDEALARAWCLEDRCRLALAAGGQGRPLSGADLERRRRWYGAETARLAAWLKMS